MLADSYVQIQPFPRYINKTDKSALQVVVGGWVEAGEESRKLPSTFPWQPRGFQGTGFEEHIRGPGRGRVCGSGAGTRSPRPRLGAQGPGPSLGANIRCRKQACPQRTPRDQTPHLKHNAHSACTSGPLPGPWQRPEGFRLRCKASLWQRPEGFCLRCKAIAITMYSRSPSLPWRLLHHLGDQSTDSARGMRGEQ